MECLFNTKMNVMYGATFCCLGNDCCIIGKIDDEYCSHDGNEEDMKRIAEKVTHSNNNANPSEDNPTLQYDNFNSNNDPNNGKKTSNTKKKDEDNKEKNNRNNKTNNINDNSNLKNNNSTDSSFNEKNGIIINKNNNSTNTTKINEIDNAINSAPLEDSSPKDKNGIYFTGIAAVFVVIAIILILILIVILIMKLRRKRERNVTRLRDSWIGNNKKKNSKNSSFSSIDSDFMDPTQTCKDYLNSLSHLQYKDPTYENCHSSNPYKKYSYFKYSPVMVPSITHSKTVSSYNTSSTPYTNNLQPILIDPQFEYPLPNQTNKSYSPKFSYNKSNIESGKYSCYKSHRESGKFSYATSNNNTNLYPNYNGRKSHYSLSNMDISNFKFPIEEEQSPLTENTSFLTTSSYQGEEDISMHLSIVNSLYRRASTAVSAPVKYY